MTEIFQTKAIKNYLTEDIMFENPINSLSNSEYYRIFIPLYISCHTAHIQTDTKTMRMQLLTRLNIKKSRTAISADPVRDVKRVLCEIKSVTGMLEQYTTILYSIFPNSILYIARFNIVTAPVPIQCHVRTSCHEGSTPRRIHRSQPWRGSCLADIVSSSFLYSTSILSPSLRPSFSSLVSTYT